MEGCEVGGVKLGVDEYVGLSCDEYVTDTGQSKVHGMKRREVHRMKGAVNVPTVE